jgi:hypothetical protein
MAVSLGFHSHFNQVTTCSQSPKKLGNREHLPIGVQTLQGGVVVHDFSHLLIIALGQGAAAKRDDAPAIAARGRGVPKGTHSIAGKPQRVIWERFAMVSAERLWCW